MEQQRNILLIVLLCVTLMLFWDWQSDKVSQAKAEQEQQQAENAPEMAAASADKTIELKSDTLDLTISLEGGDIVDAKLPKIKQEQGKNAPFHLLMTKPQFVYQIQSGLTGTDGPDKSARPLYASAQDSYVIKDGDESVSAVLTFERDGVTSTKTYTAKRGAYTVDVKYDVDNQSGRDLSMAFYGQLRQSVDDSFLRNDSSFGMVASAYRGTAYSSDSSRYEKLKLDEIVSDSKDGKNLSVQTKDGWIAMIQHYFVSAWTTSKGNSEQHTIYTNGSKDEKYAYIGMMTGNEEIKAGQKRSFENSLWIGPKEQDEMSALAPHLDLTVDYGWLWFISIPLFKVLQFVHSFLGNWGFSIIVLTLIVRGLMFPLTKAQYTSMAKMRLLTPKMQELRERYKDDRQRLGQETMKLYKQEKVNPMGGCLPLLIQMPIFIALYWMLMESTELRQSSFILWITDLSVHDPYFVLPILYGISMFFLQKMSPTPITDPIQRKVFMAMPFVFTFMFCTFPAGLTLYWLVSNCFTIFQQTVIFRSLEKKGLSMKTPAKAQKDGSGK
ncbi:MAG: membrane protein insertase YidC [Aeromonadales bacterium]|nr:membrane protein insertase YidC [Aeromonadales bacterium]